MPILTVVRDGVPLRVKREELKDGDTVREYFFDSPDSGYTEYIFMEAEQPKMISLTSIDGEGLSHNKELSKVTGYELTNIVAKGLLDVPDTTFSMPIRRDDGRLFLFEAVVKDGEFTVIVNFPTTGQYKFTDVEANIDLPDGTFTVKPIKLDIRRKIVVDDKGLA